MSALKNVVSRKKKLKCVYFGCNATPYHRLDNVHYHKFPKDPVLRRQWINIVATQRDEPSWSPSSRSLLCGQHFFPSDYDLNATGNKRLKKGVYPAKFCSNNPSVRQLRNRNLRLPSSTKIEETKSNRIAQAKKPRSALVSQPKKEVYVAPTVYSKPSTSLQSVLRTNQKQEILRTNNCAIYLLPPSTSDTSFSRSPKKMKIGPCFTLLEDSLSSSIDQLSGKNCADKCVIVIDTKCEDEMKSTEICGDDMFESVTLEPSMKIEPADDATGSSSSMLESIVKIEPEDSSASYILESDIKIEPQDSENFNLESSIKKELDDSDAESCPLTFESVFKTEPNYDHDYAKENSEVGNTSEILLSLPTAQFKTDNIADFKEKHENENLVRLNNETKLSVSEIDTVSNSQTISLHLTSKVSNSAHTTMKAVIMERIYVNNDCISILHSTNVTSMICTICKFKASSYENLCEHTTRYHDLKYECTNCGAYEMDLLNFQSHITKKHAVVNEFENMPSIIGELLARHQINHFVFTCIFCQKMFSDNNLPSLFKAIEKHNTVHNLCKICGSIFITIEELEEHAKNHTLLLKFYNCSYCNSEFRRLKSFKYHLNKTCVLYCKSFKKEKDYELNIKRIPNCYETQKLNNNELFDCPYCHCQINKKSYDLVLQHVNNHQIEACLLCSQNFISQLINFARNESDLVCEPCIAVENSTCEPSHTKSLCNEMMVNRKNSDVTSRLKLSSSDVLLKADTKTCPSISLCSSSSNDKPLSSTLSDMSINNKLSRKVVLLLPKENNDKDFKICLTIIWKDDSLNSTFVKCFSSTEMMQSIKDKFCKKGQNSINYHCTICDLNFYNCLTLYDHIFLSHSIIFSCKLSNRPIGISELTLKINQKFNVSYTIGNYMNYIGDLIDTETNCAYQCLYCHTNLPITKFYNHVITAHPSCRACRKLFQDISELSQHIRDHDMGSIKFFKCNCKEEFQSLKSATKHHEQFHKSQHVDGTKYAVETKPYIRQTTGDQPNKYLCPYCFVISETKSDFAKHISIHSVLTCGMCNEYYIVDELESTSQPCVKHDCFFLKTTTAEVFNVTNDDYFTVDENVIKCQPVKYLYIL